MMKNWMKKIDWKSVGIMYVLMLSVGAIHSIYEHDYKVVLIYFGVVSLLSAVAICQVLLEKPKPRKLSASEILDKHYPSDRTVFREGILKAMEEYANQKRQ